MTYTRRCLLALLVSVCLPAPAAEAVVLHTYMESDAEMKWDADGKRGICPEIFRAITRRDAGLKFSWEDYPVPQKRLVADLELGHIDVACALGRTAEREQQLVLTPVVLYDDALVAAVRKGDALVVNELADLGKLPPNDIILLTYGARLVGRLGDLGIRQIDDGAKRPGDNLQKLVRGRGRVFLFHEPGMAWEIHRAGLDDKVEVLPGVLSVDQHYLWLSPHMAPELVRRISRTLSELENDGTLGHIAARWSLRDDHAVRGAGKNRKPSAVGNAEPQ